MARVRCVRSVGVVALLGALGASSFIGPAHAQRAGGSQRGPFGSTQRDEGGLRGDIFALPPNTQRLPDFSTLTPIGSVYARVLDISPRPFDAGFPGVTDRFEWFALRYFGKFRTSRGGAHGFRLVSDDGARLVIDGRVVVDNDGVHPPTSVSGSIDLTAGEHTMVVEYFQGPRVEIALQLFWTPPGAGEQLFRVR